MTDRFMAEYRLAVREYILGDAEAARAQAYEIGRAAMARGLGMLDLSRLQTSALLDDPTCEAEGARAWEFFLEVLAPFEMALRGVRDVTTQLERRVEARTAQLTATQTLLREQRNMLQSVFDSIPDGVAMANTAGEFQLFNRAAAKILGIGALSGGPEVWTDAYGIFSEDETTRTRTSQIPLVRALAGEVVGEQHVFVRNDRVPNGVHVSVSGTPLFDDEGRRTGGIVVLRDTTERRRAEAAAHAAEQRLQRAQKLDAIGQLAAGVAHDFNNLLAVIASYASLLLDDLPAPDPRRADVQEIAKAATSAATLTRQLLAFSRQQVLQPTQLDLNTVVREVATMLGRTLGANVVLSTSLAPDLGMVLADRGQLEQVLMNLAVNARDAMPEGGKLTLETRNADLDETTEGARGSLAPGSYVALAVSDTGTGMDDATKARVFEPFFTTKEVGRGTGLGLATVYGIVQQSGGHIVVYSELGQGTSFKVFLPRTSAPAIAPSPSVSLHSPRGTETVLLVDDDEAVRRVATRVLRAGGYRILAASGAEEAQAIAAQHDGPIHLLVTDVVMPGVSGPHLAAELHRAWPEMLVLFMSGYAAAGVMNHGRVPPGAAFLEKPFNADSLRACVRDVFTKGAAR